MLLFQMNLLRMAIQGILFLVFVILFGLPSILRYQERKMQVINENTRQGKSLIDIVLTNDEEIILDTKVKRTYIDTDHDMVECELLLKIKKPESTVIEVEKKLLDALNYNKAEWTPIRKKLADINSTEKLSDDMEVAAMYEKLEEISS